MTYTRWLTEIGFLLKILYILIIEIITYSQQFRLPFPALKTFYVSPFASDLRIEVGRVEWSYRKGVLLGQPDKLEKELSTPCMFMFSSINFSPSYSHLQRQQSPWVIFQPNDCLSLLSSQWPCHQHSNSMRYIKNWPTLKFWSEQSTFEPRTGENF